MKPSRVTEQSVSVELNRIFFQIKKKNQDLVFSLQYGMGEFFDLSQIFLRLGEENISYSVLLNHSS